MPLSRGRADPYAKRWKKHGKPGYTPVYSFDWNEYLRHRAKDGNFHSFESKEKIPLTRDIIKKHLIVSLVSHLEIVLLFPVTFKVQFVSYEDTLCLFNINFPGLYSKGEENSI